VRGRGGDHRGVCLFQGVMRGGQGASDRRGEPGGSLLQILADHLCCII
jgi:hypothetical protein